MGAGNRMLQGRGGRNQFDITEDDMMGLRESVLENHASSAPALKIYIAGPDVFEPDSIAVGERLKSIVREHGFDPLFPMDNAVPIGDVNPSLTIFQGNAAMIRQADIVVANLNPFRGAEPDSGTVWEVGYAMGLGKRVIGYMESSQSMVGRVYAIEGRTLPAVGPYVDTAGRAVEDFNHSLNLMLIHSIEHLVIGSFEDAMVYLSSHRQEGTVS